MQKHVGRPTRPYIPQPAMSYDAKPYFEVRYGSIRYRLYVGGKNIYTDRSGVSLDVPDQELPINVRRFRRQLVPSDNQMPKFNRYGVFKLPQSGSRMRYKSARF